MPGLFLRTEYRYSTYQSSDNAFVLTPTGAPTGFGVHSNLYTQTIFTEVVWRFNFGNGLAFGH
jgi:outer membrane immunogenic protein